MEVIRKKKSEKISIKSQLLIGYLLPIIVFSVVFIVTVFVILWNRTATNIYNSYDANITQINLGISDYITKLDNGLLNLYNDENIFEYLRCASREVMYGDHESEANELASRIQDRLNSLLNINIEMYSVSLIDMKERVQTVYKHGVLPYAIEFQSTEYDKLRESYGELIVLPDHVRKNMDNSDAKVVSVGRKLIDSGNPNSLGTYVGYAIVEFEVEAIKELVERNCLNDVFSVMVFDKNDKLICFNSETTMKLDQNIAEKNPRKVSLQKDGYVMQENGISHWKIIGVIGKRMIWEQGVSVGAPLLILSVGCAAIIMLMSFRIGRTISDMLEHINQQTSALVEMEREKKDMQIRILYSQIKPHFLYNTLESIRMMSLVGEKELVSKAIKALADIFRYSTSKKVDNVTVSDEVLHVKNYFLLQKLRLGEKAELICDIDEELLNGKMLPFMLQPIVENAIKHGFKMKKDKGVIVVKADKKENAILFSVSDNGCGMTEEQIQAVYKTMDDGTSKIGLDNINRRLELLWGERLEIESMIDKGTIIRFSIPQ